MSDQVLFDEHDQLITPERQHQSNKVVREALANAHYFMTMQGRFMFEEFPAVQQSVSVLKSLCDDLQKKIEEVEPPVVKEETPKAPYVIDAGMVKGE